MNDKDKHSASLAFGIYSGAGFQLAASVVGGLLLGNYIDGKLGTAPWLALVGLVVGSVGGFVNLLRIINWHRTKKEN